METSPGISWEGMMLKLKLYYFGHLMRRADSLEKTLMLGGIEGRRRGEDRGWDGWMASLTRWTWVWVNSGSWWWTGRPGVLWFMGSQRVGHDWATDLIRSEWFFAIHQYESAIDICVPSHLPPHRNFSDGDLTATKCTHLILWLKTCAQSPGSWSQRAVIYDILEGLHNDLSF